MGKDCDEIELKGNLIEEAQARSEEICGTRTILPIPDELREPVPQTQAPQEELQLPGGILVFNHEKRAICESELGQIGDEVVIEEHKLEQVVYFSSVLSIAEDVLDYIARKGLEEWISKKFHAGELEEEEMAEVTRMKKAEARELLAVLQNVQEILDEQAEAMAKVDLTCGYKSNPVVIRCEDPLALHPEDHPDAVYEVYVEAGMFTSLYSQEDADNRALSYAQGLLNCIFGNPEVVVRCEERPDRPLPIMEPVPNDTEEIYPGRGLRVGEVVVPMNKFISSYSVDEATRVAEEWGYSQLVCWYPNDPVRIECTDPDARNEFLDPEVTERVEADIHLELPGQIVSVPRGFFISELSTALATEEAQLFAETLLRCCFINDAYYIACTPEEIRTQGNETYTILPEPEGNFELYVPRGKFTSCNSKEEANRFAQQYVEGLLVCSYCNVQVLPTCVPEWVIEGVKAGKIPLPLTGPVITDGENSIAMSKLPPEATVGYEAHGICLPDAQRAQQLSEALAAAPASKGGDWCTCYSEEVVVGCAVEDPYGNGLNQSGRGIKSNGEPYNFFSLLPQGTALSDMMSYPHPGNYIVFPSGMYTFNCYGMLDDEEEKVSAAAQVTQKVMDLAKSLIHCYIANPPAKGRCADPGENDLWGEEWVFGLGKEETERLTPWSYSEGNYIEFPGGMITREIPIDSPGSYSSLMREIYDQTRRMVEATIICAYYNEQKEGPCIPPPDESWTKVSGEELPRLITKYERHYRQANEAIVPAQTIIGETAEEADRVAQQLADAIGACDVDTVVTYEVEIPDYTIPPFPGWPSFPTPTLPIPPIITSSSPPDIPGPPGPGPGPGGGYSSVITPPGPGPGPDGGYSSVPYAIIPPGPGPGGGYSSSTSLPYFQRPKSSPRPSGTSRPPYSCPARSGCSWEDCNYNGIYTEGYPTVHGCRSPLAKYYTSNIRFRYIADKTKEYKAVYSAQSKALSAKIEVIRKKIAILKAKLK